ncbi:hypothetical protein TNCV_628061 [Trichonephila clavipes]|nr:hypothetical protein TNCV_628061 [Trichonephila clavipes]
MEFGECASYPTEKGDAFSRLEGGIVLINYITFHRFRSRYGSADGAAGIMDEYGQNPYRIQTAPEDQRTTNYSAFSEITTLQTFFFLPSGRGQLFVNQESVNQESVKCLSKGRRVFRD